jgi:glycosyltransferase involved in cell wall biosynthesis
MTTPLVSIIIPCWNGERFVGEAIESALSQTYPRVEVIVINDGSTDGTENVLRSVRGNVRWETTPNRGGCAARNRGIELARGELVQFLDADDLLYPNKLAQMVPVALGAGPRSLTVCDWELSSLNGTLPRRVSRVDYSGEDAFIFFLKKITLISSPLHWKKSLEEVGGFRGGLSCCQEYDLHLRLAVANPQIIHVPQVLWQQRRTSGSVSSSMHKVLLTRENVLLANRDELVAAGKHSYERMQAMRCGPAWVEKSGGSTQGSGEPSTACWRARILSLPCA